jgi:hypothetical protein
MRCPSNFKYAQEGGGSVPITEKCVFATNNAYSFGLRALPGFEGTDEQIYTNERARVSQEVARLNSRIQIEAPARDKLVSFQDERTNRVGTYNRIQSEYANYSSAGEAAAAIKKATDGLKPMRPPVAGSELQIERRHLLETSKPNMLLIQVALAVAVLSLLGYATMSAERAHIFAFLLLSVGIAVGIFLRK